MEIKTKSKRRKKDKNVEKKGKEYGRKKRKENIGENGTEVEKDGDNMKN